MRSLSAGNGLPPLKYAGAETHIRSWGYIRGSQLEK